jgi:SAM-dependent methyltransferase
MSLDLIRADFDRIAELSRGTSVDDWLLCHLSGQFDRALEVGCGRGLFTELLAKRARLVTAIDLSPKMLAAAKARVPGNVELVLGDAMELPFPEVDCAVSIATLHHLPFGPMLRKMREALRPGGVLLVHDLLDNSSLVGRAAAFAASLLQRKPGAPELAAAWAAHAEHDRFLKMAEIREIARAELPGARVRRHLRWRYTLTWTKA